MFALQAILAQWYDAPPPWDWGNLFWHVVQVVIYVVLGLALRIWWLGLLWWSAAHAVGLFAARTDRRFFHVLRRHLALPGHLDA